VNYKQLVAHVAQNAGVEVEVASVVVDAIFNPRNGALITALTDPDIDAAEVSLGGFGTLTAMRTSERMMVDKITGAERMTVPRRTVRLTIGGKIRDALIDIVDR